MNCFQGKNLASVSDSIRWTFEMQWSMLFDDNGVPIQSNEKDQRWVNVKEKLKLEKNSAKFLNVIVYFFLSCRES